MDIHPEVPDRLARDLDGSFEDLVLVHQRLVFGLALRVVGDRADAEEVAQDTFERAYHALAGYPAERVTAMRLRPWLARIALNLARNRVGGGAPPAPAGAAAARGPVGWGRAPPAPCPCPHRPRPSRPRWPSAARSGSCWPACWPACPGPTGRRWCYATSRAWRTRRWPRSWAGRWARSRPTCTAGCGSCGGGGGAEGRGWERGGGRWRRGPDPTPTTTTWTAAGGSWPRACRGCGPSRRRPCGRRGWGGAARADATLPGGGRPG